LFVPNFAKTVSTVVMVEALAGCQSNAREGTASMAPVGYAVDFPELTCPTWGRPQGRAEKLSASRVRCGDPAYIEFRLRAAPSVPSGHLYVVFGRLDADGKPMTRQYISACFRAAGASGSRRDFSPPKAGFCPGRPVLFPSLIG
jgi:hypothetical protein